MAKVTEIKTLCGLDSCTSVYSITGAPLSSAQGKSYNMDTISAASNWPLGKLVIKEGSIRDMTITITGLATFNITGHIRPGSKNLFGFSIAGDDSHLNSTWWNSLYPFRFPINCSNMTAGAPFVVNGTTGFSINNNVQVVWTNCGINNNGGLSVYFVNSTAWVIANDTGAVPWETERGNITSNNASGVWDSNYKGVWHLGLSANGTNLNASDSTTNGYTGAIASDTYNATGKIGGAAWNINGGSIDIGNQAGLDFTTAYTLEGCYSPEYAVNPASGSDGAILSKNAAGSYNGYIFLTGSGSTTRTLAVFINGGTRNSVAPSFTNGKYSCVAVTWNGTHISTYQNGTLISLDAYNVAPVSSASNFKIGRYTDFTTLGDIDEVRASNIARSAAVITQNYENTRATPGFGNLLTYETIPPTPCYIIFVAATPSNNTADGWDIPITISTYINGSSGTAYIEFDGVNYSTPTTGGNLTPVIMAGHKYSYIGYTLGPSNNLTERR